jgi:hypothetical protein
MQGPVGEPGPPGTIVHSQLSNLEYRNSGHTGFASQADLNTLAYAVEQLQQRLTQLEEAFHREFFID